MSTAVIRARGLGKIYQIGLAQNTNQTFREALIAAATAPWHRLRRLSGKFESEASFTALENVDLEIEAGEVVGIIGPNGAGKSTLLKILSRVTEPSAGYCEITGRAWRTA